MKHENNGHCDKCAQIFDRYPGFYKLLRDWFETFQELHPEAHVSCAGRGELDQEAAFIRKASKAHYGQSAHNYNAAFDIFEMLSKSKDIYDLKWFQTVLAPSIPSWITWLGIPGTKFWELPHLEVKEWKQLAKDGKLKLVEEVPVAKPA